MSMQLVLAGLLIGILVGMTGMGGGSLMTPLLILLGFPAAQAIGTDLLFAAVTKTLGAVQHARYKHVNWQLVRWLTLGSIPLSFAGALAVSELAEQLQDGETILRQAIAVMILGVGVMLFFRSRMRATAEARAFRPWVAVAMGALLGFLVGFTSVGSGTLFAVGLILFFHLSARHIVGTDVVHGALLVWSAAGAHALSGNVRIGTVGWLLVGSLPGVIAGSWLSKFVPERPLRLLLAATLVLSGVLLLWSR